jgi:hypothetical protein
MRKHYDAKFKAEAVLTAEVAVGPPYLLRQDYIMNPSNSDKNKNSTL